MNGAADCFLCLLRESLRTQLLLDGINRRAHIRPSILDVAADRIRLVGGVVARLRLRLHDIRLFVEDLAVVGAVRHADVIADVILQASEARFVTHRRIFFVTSVPATSLRELVARRLVAFMAYAVCSFAHCASSLMVSTVCRGTRSVFLSVS